MAKIWNPGASTVTVGAFLRDWCLVAPGRSIRPPDLFGAYEMYCRRVRVQDLTFGEFDAELERRGFRQGERHGVAVWQGLGLALLEDGLVQREYGARFQAE